MSLLMDALKRAETSKQEVSRKLTGGEPEAGNAPDLSLEPITNRATSGKPLPNLAQHLDSLNADLETSAPSQRPQPAPSSPPPLSEDENRTAIRNAFAVKEARPSSRTPLWLALGALVLAAIGIAGYVWYQLQSMNQGSLSANAPQRSLPAVPASTMPPAPQVLLPPPQYAPATPVYAENPPANANTGRVASGTEQATAFRVYPPDTTRRSAPTETGFANPTTPLRLIRSRTEPDLNIQRGYANLQGNSLDLARHDYEQALRSDPNNLDALLALGAIAQRQGRPADAERYQQRALEADPRDAGAQAAALGGSGGGDLMATESRLKSLLAAQPESAQLNFALGNLYARQTRWNEAQQLYFNAVAGDTDNPDYLFNLAVSLDQLRQPKLAAQHYRLALEAAERRPAAFERERVNKRLNQLLP